MLSALTSAERQDLIVSVGIRRSRRRVSPLRVAELMQKARSEESIEDLARDVGLTSSMVRRFLSLLDLPEEVQGSVGWGTTPGVMSFSAAAEIPRLPSREERLKLAATVIERRLSRDETKAVVQRRLRGNVLLEQATCEILKLRPAVEEQHLVVGLRLDSLAEDEARTRLRRELAQLVGARHVLSVRCKGRRFAILLSAEGAKSRAIRELMDPASAQSFVRRLTSAA